MSDLIPAKYKELFSDLWWRLNNLYYIVNEGGDKVLFKPNTAQRRLLRDMWWKNIILKSRQHGMTTFIQIFILDKILWNDNLAAGVIAHNKEDATGFFRTKIKFAYDNLPDWVKTIAPSPVKNEAGELILSNGSSVKVGTSLRSGTYQLLHISEYGKICRRYPIKAEEVKTGSLNTLHEGSMCWIESTAEGREGDLYRMSTTAENNAKVGADLSRMDYKFHFYAWHEDARNRLDAKGVVIPINLIKYFTTLKIKHAITLDNKQMAWYAKKYIEQGETSMKQEHPSTPEEAFEASVEGAYFSPQMDFLRRSKRITEVPYEAMLPVNTFWDIGMNDEMVIWFHQQVGTSNRLIDYYANSGEGFTHYAKVLRDKGYMYGTHFLPHDVAVRDLSAEGKSREVILKRLGVKPITKVPRARNAEEVYQGIQATRAFLHTCWIDEVTCANGIQHLDEYRKEWDTRNGVWKNRPAHTPASNSADALRCGAVGFKDIRASQNAQTNPEVTESY